MTAVLLPSCTDPEEKKEQFLMLKTLNIQKQVAPMHDCLWHIHLAIILVQDKILNIVTLLNNLSLYVSVELSIFYVRTNKLCGLSPRVNYSNLVTAACQQS
jgi:hypothetical protein